MEYPLDFNQEKNLLLKITRGINFDDDVSAIEQHKILSDIKHFDQQKYPKQRILIVDINNYAYAVPYIIDKKRKVIFLKTVYPDRRLTKKYLNK
jgi:hypothetical protein